MAEDDVPSRTDVLIVGCGPVGGVLAIMLGLRGVRTLVIDRAAGIHEAPRAIAFDHDALRILQSIGIDESSFAQVKIPYVRMVSPIFGEFVRINTARDIDTHPQQVTFYQPELEAALRGRLTSLSDCVRLSLGTELRRLSQDETGVDGELTLPDGRSKTVRADFVVGADGASSLVRKIIGQDFTGRSFPEDWLIVDAKTDRAPIDHVAFLCDPLRPTPHMVAPGGRVRWEFMLRKGEDARVMETDAKLDKLLAPWGGIAAMEIERRAVYRFHGRTASRFQSGRVLLVGDAAHLTPPFIGQGLVSGLRDAANLGWKLAIAVRGGADASIVDSYDIERRPHCRKIINIARFMGRLIMPRNRLAAFVTHGLVSASRLVPGIRRFIEDQGIRPEYRFRRGLFLRGKTFDGLKSGAMFPQAWLRDPGGARVRSDEVLGPHFALIGFAIDPEPFLDGTSRAVLARLGARSVHLVGRGGEARDARATVDEDGTLLARARPGTLALLRPDRMIMGTSDAAGLNPMIESANALIRSRGMPGPDREAASARANRFEIGQVEG